MRYLWWADEDYRHNDFVLLTSEDVCKRFANNIKLFTAIERAYANYEDPEILDGHACLVLEDFNKANIDKVFSGWIAQFANKGIKISHEDVKPLVDNLPFGENRHLIAETSKGFIVFTAYSLKRSGQEQQIFRYEYLPKFEECREWLKNITDVRIKDILAAVKRLDKKHNSGRFLADGDVIRFGLPLFNSAGDTTASIKTDPGIRHYAVVIGKTGVIGDDFLNNGANNAPGDDKNPHVPSLSVRSFQNKKINSKKAWLIDCDVKNHKNIMSCSPYEKPRDCAVCSVYDDVNLQYAWLGRLKVSVCQEFSEYCHAAKNIPQYILTNKGSDAYCLAEPDAKNSDAPQLRSEAAGVAAGCDNAPAIGTQPRYRLLILPFYSYETNTEDSDCGCSDGPWIVRKVVPQDDYTLWLQFEDGKAGVFDIWPLITQKDGGNATFAPLKDIGQFMKARVEGDAVCWPGNISIAPETLYDNCITVPEYKVWRAKIEDGFNEDEE